MTSKGYVAEGRRLATFPGCVCARPRRLVYLDDGERRRARLHDRGKPEQNTTVNNNVTLTATCTNNRRATHGRAVVALARRPRARPRKLRRGQDVRSIATNCRHGGADPNKCQGAPRLAPCPCNINASSATPTVGSSPHLDNLQFSHQDRMAECG